MLSTVCVSIRVFIEWLVWKWEDDGDVGGAVFILFVFLFRIALALNVKGTKFVIKLCKQVKQLEVCPQN